MDIYHYYLVFVAIQLLHSQEEIWTSFHKRWFVLVMPRWVFISFEIVLSVFIACYAFWPSLALGNIVMPTFILIMFVNGVGHVIWGLNERCYVPGLVTAPFFIVAFVFYYLDIIGAF